eukprot:8204019-Pyramimonas_sp.AAC.1
MFQAVATLERQCYRVAQTEKAPLTKEHVRDRPRKLSAGSGAARGGRKGDLRARICSRRDHRGASGAALGVVVSRAAPPQTGQA